MKQTRIIMGMPIGVEIVDSWATAEIFDEVFSYFGYVDKKFSTYASTSEIAAINRGALRAKDWSEDMRTVLRLSAETKKETDGYFDITTPAGTYDPSGLVKGWAIQNAAKLLRARGFKNFYVDAGGDIQAHGKNRAGEKWSVGIKNPFNQKEIVKVVRVEDEGVATSGTYIRGRHIYNPKNMAEPIEDPVSLTVIGPNVYEADRFATAAFAMGRNGIAFIEKLPRLEGYMIDRKGIATMTNGFPHYARAND